nr:amnioglycoside phosphotransferase [Streptomyces sp. RK44]
MIDSQEVLHEPAQARFEPVDLSTAPEVNALLTRLGLGSFRIDTVVAHVGRNDNWAGKTTTGRPVFVKRLGGDRSEAARRYRRIVTFERLAAELVETPLASPRLLGADEQQLLVLFEGLEDARSGSELAADGDFDEDLCHEAGRMLGVLHSSAVEPGELDETPHPLPPMESFEALSLPRFVDAGFAEMEAWSLLQADRQLISVLRALREHEASARKVPTHGDLRLDQYLLHGDTLHLTDWEELRLGDPARDIGGFVGEWLYRAVRDIPKTLRHDADRPFDQEATHREILTYGAREIERLHPRMHAFWEGYLREGTTAGKPSGQAVDADLPARAAAFAGWHMIDRLLANAPYVPRIGAADRAAAGIGRVLLLDPYVHVSTLGLEKTR